MKTVFVFIVLLFFLVIPQSAFAVTQLSVKNVPLTIDKSQDFEVDINFSCTSCGDSYLRGVFYPSGSSYFGYTQDNAGNWSNAPGGNCTTYFKIAQSDLTPEGSWSGKLKFKTDTNSSYYSGPAEYLFKVGRYTPSCSSPSVWSQESTVAITGPTPTPTSAPTSISTPTSVKTPTPTLVATITKVASVSPTEILPTDVLGESTDDASLDFDPTETPQASETPIKNNSVKVLGIDSGMLSKGMIGTGLILMISCGILTFLKWKKYL